MKHNKQHTSNPTQLSDNVKRHFNLLIERTCTPATNGSMEIQLAEPSAEFRQPRKASVSRLVERVTSSTSSRDQDQGAPQHPAPAIPMPKSAALSSQICLAVKREGDVVINIIHHFSGGRADRDIHLSYADTPPDQKELE